MRHTLTALLAAVALSACATSGRVAPEAAGPVSLVAAPGLPAPPQAKFYADCIAQAAAANTYDREANLIRFTCNGAAAQAFFEGLAAYSAEIGAERTGEGRIMRFTQKVGQSVRGLDYCWQETGAAPGYGCTVIFNVGAFLAK